MSEIRDIQVLALGNIEEPNSDAYYRRICRWYSREFSTPLETVINDIPERDVLLHYYEDLYESLYKDDSEEGQLRYFGLRSALLRTSKDVVVEEVQAVEDDKWADEMNEQIRLEEEAAMAKSSKKSKTNVNSSNPNLIPEDFNISVKGE